MSDITGDDVLIWLETHQHQVNRNMQTPYGFNRCEVVTKDKKGQYRLFPGRTLKECVIKVMEDEGC